MTRLRQKRWSTFPCIWQSKIPKLTKKFRYLRLRRHPFQYGHVVRMIIFGYSIFVTIRVWIQWHGNGTNVTFNSIKNNTREKRLKGQKLIFLCNLWIKINPWYLICKPCISPFKCYMVAWSVPMGRRVKDQNVEGGWQTPDRAQNMVILIRWSNVQIPLSADSPQCPLSDEVW